MKSSVQTQEFLDLAVRDAITRASSSLFERQSPEGYWWADLRADSTLESDYILMELWLHPPVDGVWNPPTRAKVDRAVQAIVARQLADGGFNIYLEGPSEVNASIKAYFALKVAGLSPNDLRMERLRNRILELGGLQAANSYVRTNLGLFNLFPRDACPSIPPEIILLPFKFIYRMSSWTRAIVLSLSIVHAANPQRPVPSGLTLEELFLPGAPMLPERDSKLLSWRNLFLLLDSFLKRWEKLGLHVVRNHAIKKCGEWMIEHFEASDGLGAIYPSMQYAVMALDVLGYPADHPLARRSAEHSSTNLMVDDGSAASTCSRASHRSGIPPSPRLPSPKADAFLEKALQPHRRLAHFERRSDAKATGRSSGPNAEPSGWAFEFNNDFYPDVDDTAMVLLALDRMRRLG